MEAKTNGENEGPDSAGKEAGRIKVKRDKRESVNLIRQSRQKKKKSRVKKRIDAGSSYERFLRIEKYVCDPRHAEELREKRVTQSTESLERNRIRRRKGLRSLVLTWRKAKINGIRPKKKAEK